MVNKLSISLILLSLSLILQPESHAVQIQDLLGINGSPNDPNLEEFDIKWIRIDFSWKNIEKEKGVYNWEKYDNLLISAQKKGYKILPILAYTPPWGGDGSQSSPPANDKQWTDFISNLVKRYSNQPYRIEYFQIWNEPTKKAGFWKGTNEQFINSIYLPAAKIIKESGGKVVFGGWPVSNSITELIEILNLSNAYAYTDIIDFHYRSTTAYNTIYEKFMKNGVVSGIWQTEIGYTNKPYFLLTEYTKILAWVIKHRWDNPNKYKIFWYPFFSNRQNYKKAIFTEKNNKKSMTDNGKQLKQFLDIYSGGDLHLLEYFSNDAYQKDQSFAINIQGKKIVYATFSVSAVPKEVNITTADDIKIRSAMIYCPSGIKTKYSDYTEKKGSIVLNFDNNLIKNTCGDIPVFYTVLQY